MPNSAGFQASINTTSSTPRRESLAKGMEKLSCLNHQITLNASRFHDGILTTSLGATLVLEQMAPVVALIPAIVAVIASLAKRQESINWRIMTWWYLGCLPYFFYKMPIFGNSDSLAQIQILCIWGWLLMIFAWWQWKHCLWNCLLPHVSGGVDLRRWSDFLGNFQDGFCPAAISGITTAHSIPVACSLAYWHTPSSPSTEVKVYLITCVCICHPKKKVYRSGRCIPLLDGNCMELRHLSIATFPLGCMASCFKIVMRSKRENGHHVRSCWKLVNPILTKCADSCADIVLLWETVFCDTFPESLLLRN